MKITTRQYALLATGILILITALGNAKIMFTVSIIGLLLGVGFLKKEPGHSSIFAVTIGFFLTLIIAILVMITGRIP